MDDSDGGIRSKKCRVAAAVLHTLVHRATAPSAEAQARCSLSRPLSGGRVGWPCRVAVSCGRVGWPCRGAGSGGRVGRPCRVAVSGGRAGGHSGPPRMARTRMHGRALSARPHHSGPASRGVPPFKLLALHHDIAEWTTRMVGLGRPLLRPAPGQTNDRGAVTRTLAVRAFRPARVQTQHASGRDTGSGHRPMGARPGWGRAARWAPCGPSNCARRVQTPLPRADATPHSRLGSRSLEIRPDPSRSRSVQIQTPHPRLVSPPCGAEVHETCHGQAQAL